MKKPSPLSVSATYQLHRPSLRKVKTGALLLLAGLFAQCVFGQKVCDTLYTTNGSKILIEIVRAYQHGLVYTKCEEPKGFEYYTISDEIITIRYQNPEMRSPYPMRKKQKLADTSTLKHQEFLAWATAKRANGLEYPNHTDRVGVEGANGLKQPKFILWAGFDMNNFVNYGSHFLKFPIQFSVEMNFPNHPMRLGLSFQRYSFKDPEQADNKGFEVGLVAKKFSIGRLSGLTKAGYWGADVRVGQHSYTITDLPGKTIRYNWYKVMPCIGFQFANGPIAIDFRLPVGIEFLSGKGADYAENWQDIASEPTISIGVRF